MHEVNEGWAMGLGERGKRVGTPAKIGRLLFWLFAMAVLMLGLGSRTALAQSATCSGSAQTVPISMPASITVPRDAANGTILTSWVSTAATTNYYNCTVVPVGNTVRPASGMAFEPLSMTKAGLSVTGPNGAAYTVWNTNVPGVGIAIGVRLYVNGCGWQAWGDLGTPSGFLPSPWKGSACNANGSVTNGGQAQMALVKTGTITAGTVSGGVLFEGASVTAMDINGPYTIATSGRKSFSLSQTIINVAACTTPNVTVTMGSYKQSAFTGVGSTTPAVAFNVGVNACPAGLNSIQYQFIPVNAVLDTTNGVLALSSDSTAAGIGLQLRDNSGKALKYNTQYTLTSYNGSTGGSYTIPLTANYYQTSASVAPGSANAVLTFTMTYQ
ncbi:pilus assembly protein [Burkholderia gladioli]|uniref:fimbrial protein n=1 Tax=Burkholderia gladioli TaxID=28095 RepID=UPI000627011A|nr:fimbrial protein [Burkholderia gladioli]KAF1057817.1 Type-1 fimbrial protein, A chain [Burkholderia gladioli]KKJ02516.1 pilus assembly protein [Burkholderia gladioli]MDN7496237.1 fimbrial protein [Burkholderia gladioli]WAG22049.1 pilus assembly protein [Burkholderia gladioli]